MIADIFTAIAAGFWAIFNGIGFGVIGAIETIEHLTEISQHIVEMLQGIM